MRECVTEARIQGYRGIRLWTTDVLHAARQLYEKEGFRLEKEASWLEFGPPLRAQTWGLLFAGRA